MLALLLASTTVSAESTRNQQYLASVIRQGEKETTQSAIKTDLIQGIDEDIGLNSVEGEIVGANNENTEIDSGKDFVQVEEQIKIAVQKEKMAEQKALMAEEKMRQAASVQ